MKRIRNSQSERKRANGESHAMNTNGFAKAVSPYPHHLAEPTGGSVVEMGQFGKIAARVEPQCNSTWFTNQLGPF